MRKKGVEEMRQLRTHQGPPPLPELQPSTSPPSSTPANRRRARMEQLLRGGDRGDGTGDSGHPTLPRRRWPGDSSVPTPGGPQHAPPAARPATESGGPQPCARPASRTLRTAARTEPPKLRKEQGAAEAGPLPQASGCCQPSARPLVRRPRSDPGQAGPRRRRSPSSQLHS